MMNEIVGQYKCGMSEAWDIAKEVESLSPYERSYLFGYENAKYVFRMFEPQEVREILNNREETSYILVELELFLKRNGKEADRTELERFFYSLKDV